MCTFKPLKVPSYIYPRSKSESVHMSRSTFLTPHTLLSSYSSSQSGTLLGLGMSQRTCAGGEHGKERNGVEAHIVQTVDEPSQILILQIWNSILVFVLVEVVGDLVVEIGQKFY